MARFEDVSTYADRLLRFIREPINGISTDFFRAVNWYPEALDTAYSISYGLPIERVVGCIAALSPRCRWETNIVWAKEFTYAYTHNLPMPQLHTTAPRHAAWDALHGRINLQGPKVRSFYANIMGDYDAITIDSHMCFVFFGQVLDMTDHQYLYPSQAVRAVGLYLGYYNCIIQAAGWLKARKLRPMKQQVWKWWTT